MQLRGDWTALALSDCHRARALRNELHKIDAHAHWSLARLARLDHIGAQLMWQAWGGKLPEKLEANEAQRRVFTRIAGLRREELEKAYGGPVQSGDPVRRLDPVDVRAAGQWRDHAGPAGLRPAAPGARAAARPWREISANIYNVGYKALGITALVGLIGIVLSYLSANQLRTFGASIFIVNILGMAVIRELGPVLAAILIAGRSGSAITAQIGVMRVTEELDAMRVMGISHGFRLIMPRVIALAIAMPLLVAWTDVLALTGGMLAAHFQLDISVAFFLRALPDAVPVANLWMGLGKGVVFGILIALTACHFGLRIEPNTRSLGEGTTASVVTSITVVIVADAIFAILFKDIGL